MEPKIAREFYLLSLNPKNGYYINAGNEFGYGILAAVILDMYRAGKIGIRDKKIVLLDSSSTNHPLFERVITILRSKGEISPSRLLYKLAFKGNATKKELVKMLLENEDIRAVQKTFLGIRYQRYYTKNTDSRQALIRRLRDILLRNEQAQSNEMLLLILIPTCRLYRSLSDQRVERKQMRKKLRSLVINETNYGNNYSDVNYLHQSIRKVISASNTVHTQAY